MKFRRLLLLTLIFSLAGAATVFADSVYEKYTAKKITIVLNGVEVDSPGLMVDMGKEQTKTMLPLRDLSKSIGGLVSWNEVTNTVKISKPNVQLSMLLAKDKRPYGAVSKGKYDIIIFAQVDSLFTEISNLKISIVDPFGSEIESNIEAVKEQKENFWYMSQPLAINFKYTVAPQGAALCRIFDP
jgi:hypothetical protein